MKQSLLYRQPYGKYRDEDLDTLRFMRECGIKNIQVTTSNTQNGHGDFYSDSPLIWNDFQTYDFKALDSQLQQVLDIVPDAELYPLLDLNCPPWLARKLGEDAFSHLSEISLNTFWKEQTIQYMTDFLNHCESTFGDKIKGYVIACGRTMEWFESAFDRPGAEKSLEFTKYCKAKNLPFSRMPDYSEIQKTPAPALYESDAVVEWERFCAKITADLAITFVRTAKELLNGHAEVGLFYGYFHYLLPNHADAERFFREAHPDFVVGAVCNCEPAIGGNCGTNASLLTLKRYGIPFLCECDRMTSTANRPVYSKGSIWEHYWKNDDDDAAGLKREASVALINGFSFWFFNIWGNAYQNPKAKEAIRKIAKIWESYAEKSTGSTAEILLVADPESIYRINFRQGAEYRDAVGWKLRKNLALSGRPFDTAICSDLEHVNLSQYRLILFQSPFSPKIKPLKNQNIFYADFQNYNNFASLEWLRNQIVLSGIHEICKDAAVWHSREFLMVHSASGGEKEIHLPEKANAVTELFSKQIIARNTSVFSDSFSAPDTKLYYLK